MVLKLYTRNTSPPCRSVHLTAKLIGIDIEKISVDLSSKEHMKPEFSKKNPNRTVPVLDDDGFVLSDSHAICAYLVSAYGKDDALYPKDPKKRAKVDQIMYFDSGTLFSRIRNMLIPMWFGGRRSFDQSLLDTISETYGMIEMYLKNSQWLAGSQVTIADICVFTSVHYISMIVPIENHATLSEWLERCSALPHAEEVNKGCREILLTELREKGVKF